MAQILELLGTIDPTQAQCDSDCIAAGASTSTSSLDAALSQSARSTAEVVDNTDTIIGWIPGLGIEAGAVASFAVLIIVLVIFLVDRRDKRQSLSADLSQAAQFTAKIVVNTNTIIDWIPGIRIRAVAVLSIAVFIIFLIMFLLDRRSEQQSLYVALSLSARFAADVVVDTITIIGWIPGIGLGAIAVVCLAEMTILFCWAAIAERRSRQQMMEENKDEE